MEGQEGLPKNIVKKSPQELAAQTINTFGVNLEPNFGEKGKVLDEKFKDSKKKISDLLKSGVENEELSSELDSLYQMAKSEGLYDPLNGPNAEEFLELEKQRNLGFGYSESDAKKEALKGLSKEGYLAALRSKRRFEEQDVQRKFDNFGKEKPIDPVVEKERIDELRKKCIYLNETQPEGFLAEEFPGGNFLFHGTNINQAIKILESGDIVSSKELFDREEQRSKKEGRPKDFFKRNSGYEGISWNFNRVSALPGDRYHLVGFLGSVDGLLSEDLQLTIPSRPAADELIMLTKDIDPQKFYFYKIQSELLEDLGLFGDKNSVFSNISSLARINQTDGTEDANPYIDNKSMINDFCQKEMSDEEMTSLLRSKYTIAENGRINFSIDLYQQVNNEISVGAVWLQALIDTGRIKNIPGMEGVLNIRQIRAAINEVNKINFFREIKRDARLLEEEFGEEDKKVQGICVSTSEMFIVLPKKDLEKWLRVLARTDAKIKGVLVYEGIKVRLENFASEHVGDHDNLTQILRQAIPVREGYLDYEEEMLGSKISPDKMRGNRHQVIGEEFIKKRKSIKKDSNGQLVIS